MYEEGFMKIGKCTRFNSIPHLLNILRIQIIVEFLMFYLQFRNEKQNSFKRNLYDLYDLSRIIHPVAFKLIPLYVNLISYNYNVALFHQNYRVDKRF